MFHCRGGFGVDRFDALTPLVNWVEQGVAPDALLAAQVDSGGGVKRTRPLCPYPQVARYKGSGDAKEASSFSCRLP
jgi:feruloyl esterase